MEFKDKARQSYRLIFLCAQERFERIEFQQKVRRSYEELSDESWVWIDATGEKEIISALAFAALEKCILCNCEVPLREMWIQWVEGSGESGV